jgi:hypothetical protein
MPVLKIKQNGEWIEVGGAGVSSWNDLKDKPFGETTIIGETLYWDGNLEGRPTLEYQASNFFVWISEATPSLT